MSEVSMSAYDLANQLAGSIRASAEYRNFIAKKEMILADEANHKIVRDFQLKQWEIQQEVVLGQDISMEKKHHLERLYSLLSINPKARQYLEAEFQISRLVNDIQKIIGEAIQEAVPIGLEELDIHPEKH